MDAGEIHPSPGFSVIDVQFHDPDAYVLTLRGSADHTCITALEAALTRAADSGSPFIVDLGALAFGDESLLGLLLHTHRTHPLALVGPLAPSFRRRLDVTGTLDVFTLHVSLSQALTGIRG